MAIMLTYEQRWFDVILLQIVMVSPGTHLVKNHASLFITNECQFKKTRSPKLKMLGPLCSQTVNLETDAKTLNYRLLELNYSLSIYLKHKKDCIFKQQPEKTHKQDILLKHLQIDRSIVLCVPRDAFHKLFCVFVDFDASGT